MNRLLTQQEVCDLLRISYPTLYRWMNSGTFPAPVNGRGRKLLWTQDAIEEWTNRQSPVNAPTPAGAAKKRRERKSYEQRQALAEAALRRHRSSNPEDVA